MQVFSVGCLRLCFDDVGVVRHRGRGDECHRLPGWRVEDVPPDCGVLEVGAGVRQAAFHRFGEVDPVAIVNLLGVQPSSCLIASSATRARMTYSLLNPSGRQSPDG